jgi:hypothetical protein
MSDGLFRKVVVTVDEFERTLAKARNEYLRACEADGRDSGAAAECWARLVADAAKSSTESVEHGGEWVNLLTPEAREFALLVFGAIERSQRQRGGEAAIVLDFDRNAARRTARRHSSA